MPSTTPRARLCPACGGTLDADMAAAGQTSTCAACGRLAVEPLHTFSGVYDAVEYEFDDLAPAERAAAADLLVGASVPYRWDPGFRLQVPPEREQDVDALFETLRPYEGEVDTEPLEALGRDDKQPDEWVADERSVEALASLFDAADRLRHHPDDEAAVAELSAAAGVVTQAPVPFGVTDVLWQTVGDLTRQLVDLLGSDADRDNVIAGADALRAVLRDHV